MTLTSAAVAPAAPAPAPAAAPAAAENDEAAEPSDETEAEAAKAAPAAKRGDGPMTFEEITAALGESQKMTLDLNDSSSSAPAVKPLSADGYTAVGATHQAVDTGSGARAAGDIKLSGGLTAAAVKAGVHDAAGRLRACYEHGLAANPRLAGRVMVSFEVDARGGVSSVETASDAIPADVRACVGAAFSSITFAMPKTAPAKIVYPVDFNKDS